MAGSTITSPVLPVNVETHLGVSAAIWIQKTRLQLPISNLTLYGVSGSQQ